MGSGTPQSRRLPLGWSAVTRQGAFQACPAGDAELAVACPRCASTVLTVTNSVAAMPRLLCPAAASSAMRRSLGVSASTPARRILRWCTPVALSSSCARAATGYAPHSRAVLGASRSGPLAAAAQRRAELEQRPGALQPRGGDREQLGRRARQRDRLVALAHRGQRPQRHRVLARALAPGACDLDLLGCERAGLLAAVEPHERARRLAAPQRQRRQDAPGGLAAPARHQLLQRVLVAALRGTWAPGDVVEQVDADLTAGLVGRRARVAQRGVGGLELTRVGQRMHQERAGLRRGDASDPRRCDSATAAS